MKAMMTFVLAVCVTAMTLKAQEWQPVPGKLMTRWGKEVRPQSAWTEYPRPTMVRADWQSLNGLWNYAITKGERPDIGPEGQKILVPFAPESPLSGVGRTVQPDETLWYWRKFTVPDFWKDYRILLNFGAVDWHAKVSVNGKPVGEHKGGFDPFTCDITDTLVPGSNEVVVEVKDGTDQSGQPRGKQWLKPGGIWYTPTSGIWQTVWLEPVWKPAHITDIKFEPNIAGGYVDVTVTVKGDVEREGINFSIRDGQRVIAANLVPDGKPARFEIANPKVWTPDAPFLYETTAKIRKGMTVNDPVRSYFAFREVKVGKDDKGVNRLMLNGKPVFQFGPLDQGFWPDGLYTPPSDEAMKFDIMAVKQMGGNMLRKHVKVEPERFYYWCDKLGVMVWQDMPSAFFGGPNSKEGQPEPTDAWKSNFEHEWFTIMKSLNRHPSIVMWVPFNEGWGQNDLEWAARVAKITQDADPTRLVNCASGWTDMKVGHVRDVHDYPGPGTAPVEPDRAIVLGEFGGLGLPIEGHTWVDKDNWGYVSYKSKEELTDAYVGLLKQLPMLIGEGLAAAVYTQTTDVEIECNGWLTYDREVWKIDPAKAAEAAKALYLPPPTVSVIVPRAGQGEAPQWSYTTEKPGDDWMKPGFSDGSWSKGASGFGTRGTPGAQIGTEWKSSEIWIRREFELASVPANPLLSIHHDEDAEVYINGELAVSFSKWSTGYKVYPLSEAAAKLLKAGKNTLAIHCKQTNGGQYIDCGIVELAPAN